MNNAEFQVQALGDPRLAVHATSALPAWLWSSDGMRVLWSNPVGARAFGAANSTALANKIFGPADPHRRQIARLAGRLPANGAVRLERLQGFGAAPGMLATCGCSRLDLPDGSHGILVAASNGSGRTMPLTERLQRLVEGLAMPVAAFTREGMLIGTSDAARPLLGFHNLVDAGLDDARNDALKQGAVATAIDIGRMVLQRVGTGADTGLVALIVPDVVGTVPLRPSSRSHASSRKNNCLNRSRRRLRPPRTNRRPNTTAAGADGRSARRAGAVRRLGRRAGSARSRAGRRGRAVQQRTIRRVAA